MIRAMARSGCTLISLLEQSRSGPTFCKVSSYCTSKDYYSVKFQVHTVRRFRDELQCLNPMRLRAPVAVTSCART